MPDRDCAWRGGRERRSACAGPFSNLAAFATGHSTAAPRFSAPEVLSWNDSASLPLLPTDRSVEIFAQLRKSPRLDLNNATSWRVRPDRELDATNQKSLMDLEVRNLPARILAGLQGRVVRYLDTGHGGVLRLADPKVVIPWIYAKRLKSGKSRRPRAHSEFAAGFRQDKGTLACHRARIAFRDVSRATDSRTFRAALLPPRVFVGNQAPYLLWPVATRKTKRSSLA